SMGKVICCSTSSGPRAGALVLICTWTGVVSGKASRSRWRMEKTPPTAKASATPRTRRRCRSEKSMIQFNTGLVLPENEAEGVADGPTGPLFVAPSALAQLGLEEFRLEDAAALAGDDFPRQHAGQEFRVPVIPGPEPDLADVEDLRSTLLEVVLVADENDEAVTLPVNRLVGHDHRVRFLAQDDPTGA